MPRSNNDPAYRPWISSDRRPLQLVSYVGGFNMRFRRVIIALAIICSLVTWGWATAQMVAIKPVPPRVMTGADVGFRVEGLRGNTPVGRIVVRVNGDWVEAELTT